MRRRIVDLHGDWLPLLEVEGRFLSVPVLRELFPAGMPPVDDAVRREAGERLAVLTPVSAESERDTWIDWLLQTALGWGDLLERTDLTYAVPEHRTMVAAHRVLRGRDGRIRVVVVRVPYGSAFDSDDFADGWRASSLDRAERLARHAGARIAFVTDGSSVAVQWVPAEGHGGYGTWATDLFAESAERALFAVFIALFDARRFFGSLPEDEPEAVFERSSLHEAELTDTLGRQVRGAVELLVAAFWSSDRERTESVLRAVPPNAIYQAAATVVMRLVFLLFAEERQLLPLADPLYARHYAVSTLRAQLDADAIRLGDEPLELRASAWRRLLAAFAAVHDGIEHDRLRQPGYGGRLFEPLRHAFLAELSVDDLTVRAVLAALQLVGGRRLSFLHLDVEQIGHIYEGLLDHDVVRVRGVHVVLSGAGEETRVPLPLAQLEVWSTGDAAAKNIAEATGRSEVAIRRVLEARSEGDANETRRLLTAACESDLTLVVRVMPFAGLIARDLRGIPIVVAADGLVVKKTSERRNSGTEYTPRSLAEEIVQYALEPLAYAPGARDGVPRENWVLRPSDELLALRIVDPACGSGAFLVSACRFLADRVAEAWAAEGRATDDDVVRDAQRLVAQRCLFGVDRDVMAVEMAKLSLWLLTFSRGKPFGFLDHALREGDSLLGITSLDQLTALHLDPDRGLDLHRSTLFDRSGALLRLVGKARESRQEIEEEPPRSLEDAERKARLQARAETATETARLAADGVIAIELALSDRPAKEREAALLELADEVAVILDDDDPAQRAALRERVAMRLNMNRPEGSPPRRPLHWPLEFPEVFDGRGGFDVVIGNPPFLNGRSITVQFGIDYRALLQRSIAQGRKGHADLVAYFVLRAAQIGGRFATLATNSISQGDTREVALDALCASNWRIVRAQKSRAWPGSASVHISQLWCVSGVSNERAVLEGRSVGAISPLLVPESRWLQNPQRLSENRNMAYQGSLVLGKGFVISPLEARAMIALNEKNEKVIRPYINASDICTIPTLVPPRFVIDFRDWSEASAKQFTEPYDHLRKTVYSERNSSEKRRQWWIHWRRRAELYRRISLYKEIIALPRHSKYVTPVRLPSTYVYSEALVLFASESYGLQGVLTSGIHQAWSRARGSTLKSDLRYTPTDCFETFPLPADDRRVAEVMRDLQALRTDLMHARSHGVTALYNVVHDSRCLDAEVEALRSLHEALDAAVAAAYRWSDLNIAYGFHQMEEGLRWTFAEETRVELIDRLGELNAERAQTEAAAPGGDRKRGQGVPQVAQVSFTVGG